MLRAAKQDSAITEEIRKAPLLGPTDNVAALEQVVASQSTTIALQNLATQKPPSMKANCPTLTLLPKLWEF